MVICSIGYVSLIDFVAASKTRPNKQFINISEHIYSPEIG